MNRQVVAFLSLFSLVLVLSIYYVMIPFANNNNNSKPVAGSQVSDITDASTLFFETLALERDQKHEEYIKQQEEIIASSEYTGEEKLLAFENIEKERQEQAQEVGVESAILGIGYPSCFVEIDPEYINVLAYKQTPTNVDAANIIFTVQDFLDLESNIVVEFRS